MRFPISPFTFRTIPPTFYPYPLQPDGSQRLGRRRPSERDQRSPTRLADPAADGLDVIRDVAEDGGEGGLARGTAGIGGWFV